MIVNGGSGWFDAPCEGRKVVEQVMGRSVKWLFAQERHEISEVPLPVVEQMIYMKGTRMGNHDDPSVFEAVTRQMVETLADELREIRRRVDGLLWMGGGAILIDTILRVAGVT